MKNRINQIVNETVTQVIDTIINEGIDFDPQTKTVSYNPSHEEMLILLLNTIPQRI